MRVVLTEQAMLVLEPRYRAALGGQAQAFDYETRDGWRTYRVEISPMRDATGAINSVVAVIQDKTEHLRTATQLARSEARLRDAERIIGVGTWELALDNRTITYSDGFARAVGLDAGRHVTLEAIIARVHPEDREA